MTTSPSPSAPPADLYERLRHEIVSGRLLPSQRLVEADLTREHGATRSAVRAALLRLVQDGLVVHERNRGAKVRLVDEHEAIEILEARAVLEGLLARKAAENITDEAIADLQEIVAGMRRLVEKSDLLAMSELNSRLHAIVQRAAQHGTVERLVSTLNWHLVRFQYRTILLPGRPDSSLAEHTALVAALSARDPEAAERAMVAHVSGITEALRSSLKAAARAV
jgi:DNA-binding GntR family transcriptional regulator